MCDTKKYSTVPDNADKVLFAEDFVNHVLQNHNLPLLSSGIADHRDFIYNAFNPQVGIAANYCADQMKDAINREFAYMLRFNLKAVTENKDIGVFSKYAISFRTRSLEAMLPIESRAGVFLHFCVKISACAVDFYNAGILEAPDLAFEYITTILDGINMVDEGGWKALHLLAANYSQLSIDKAENYLTPESASDSDSQSTDTDWHTSDFMSSVSSSGENSDGGDNQDEHAEKLTDNDFCTMCMTEMCTSSAGQDSSSYVCTHVSKTEASRSPDHEVDCVDNQNELPEKLTHNNFCTTCINAMISPSEGQDSSSFVCEHVEKTIDVVSENVESFPDNKTDSVSLGESKEKDSEDSFHSFEETSSEDETSKRKKLKKRRKKQTFMRSKDSDSDPEKGGRDIAKAD